MVIILYLKWRMFDNGDYTSILDYDNVDWFSIENIKVGNKMDFYLQKSRKDILMTEKDEEEHKNNSICRICGKKVFD